MRIRFAMHLSRALKDAECSIIWPIILIILISLFGRNLFGDSVLLETLWCDCGVIGKIMVIGLVMMCIISGFIIFQSID